METRRGGWRPDRLRAGEWIIGVASLALLIDLFLPWYDERSEFVAAGAQIGLHTTYTATQAYNLVGPFALACALVGLILWGAQATVRSPALPICLTVIAATLDLILVIALLIRVVFVQFSLSAPATAGTDTLKLGVPAIIGLFCAAFMSWGTWLSLREDGVATGDAPARVETLRLSQRRR